MACTPPPEPRAGPRGTPSGPPSAPTATRSAMRTPPAAGTSRRPTTPQRCSAQEQRGASPPAPPRTEPSPPDSPSHPHVPPTSTGLRPPACRRRSPRRSRTPSRNPRHYPWTAHGMRLVADSPDDDRRLLVTVSFRAAGPRPPRRGRPSRGSTPNLGRGGTRDERCPMWAPSRASWPARPSISSPGWGALVALRGPHRRAMPMHSRAGGPAPRHARACGTGCSAPRTPCPWSSASTV